MGAAQQHQATDETKTWVRFSRSAQGASIVTVTVQRGSCVARWSEKAFPGQLEATIINARERAADSLTELERALAAIDLADVA